MTRHKKNQLYSFNPRLIINRSKVAYSYLKRSPYNTGMPIEVVIEPTNICNFKCPMCPRDQDNTMSTRGLGYMKMPVFRKIIDEIKDQAETVDLYLAGEPLVHPDIIEMINYCEEKNVRCVMHTNASLLTEEKAKLILDSPLSLFDISFDGVTKETYEQIRVGGKYEVTLRNIERYLELKTKHSGPTPYTIVHMIYMEKNKHEVEAFLKKWKRAGVDEVRVKPFNRANLPGKRSMLGVNSTSRTKIVKRFHNPCPLLWRFFVVHWDGTVVPCCLDFIRKEPLGNIMEQSFEEIWNGPRMKNLRSLHVQGKSDEVPLCKGCSRPTISPLALLATIFIDNTTLKQRLLPIVERFLLLKKINLFNYFGEK